MTGLVYLVERENLHEVANKGLSQLEPLLREEGYLLGDLQIEHALLDYRKSLYGKESESVFVTDILRLGEDRLGLEYLQEDRERRLGEMIESYTKEFEAPYFAIMPPDLRGDVIRAFDEQRIEIKWIRRVDREHLDKLLKKFQVLRDGKPLSVEQVAALTSEELASKNPKGQSIYRIVDSKPKHGTATLTAIDNGYKLASESGSFSSELDRESHPTAYHILKNAA